MLSHACTCSNLSIPQTPLTKPLVMLKFISGIPGWTTCVQGTTGPMQIGGLLFQNFAVTVMQFQGGCFRANVGEGQLITTTSYIVVIHTLQRYCNANRLHFTSKKIQTMLLFDLRSKCTVQCTATRPYSSVSSSSKFGRMIALDRRAAHLGWQF